MDKNNYSVKEFGDIWRKEMKLIKRSTKDVDLLCNPSRHLNIRLIELEALSVVIMRHNDLTNELIEKLIVGNRNKYRFSNTCLAQVPNMIDMLRENNYLGVAKLQTDYYRNLRQDPKKLVRSNRPMGVEEFAKTLKPYIDSERIKMGDNGRKINYASYYTHIAQYGAGNLANLAELQGLYVWLLRNEIFTSKQVASLIARNKKNFPFIYECGRFVPDMINELKTHGAVYVFLKYHDNKIIYKRKDLEINTK